MIPKIHPEVNEENNRAEKIRVQLMENKKQKKLQQMEQKRRRLLQKFKENSEFSKT